MVLSPIHRRLILLALCIAGASVALAAAGLQWMEQRERAHQRELLRVAAAQLAARVDAELGRSVAKLNVLAASPLLRRGDLAGFHQLASEVVAADPGWENLQLISLEGQQLVNVRLPYGQPLPPLNRPDLPLAAVVSGEPVISDMAMGVVAGRLLTPIYVPVRIDDKPAYVIVAAIEPPNWRTLLRETLPKGMEAALLDRFSFLIANTMDLPPQQLGALPTAPGELTGALDEKAALVASHLTSLVQWRVVTFLPQPQPAHRLLLAWQAWGTLFALALVASVVAAVRLARSISAARAQQ